MRLWLVIREVFRDFPGLLTLNVLMLAAVGVAEAASIVSVAPVVDFLINPGLDRPGPLTLQAVALITWLGFPVGLPSMLGLFLALNLIRAGFQILVGYFIFRTQHALLGNLLLGTYQDLFNARWSLFSGTANGVLMNTFVREIEVVGGAFGSMARFLAGLVQLALYLVIPALVSWQITAISMTAIAACALPFMALGRVNYRFGMRCTAAANRMTSLIQEALGSAKLILGFGNQRQTVDALRGSYQLHRAATIRKQTLSAAIPALYRPLGLAVLILALLAAQRFGVPISETAVVLYALFQVIPLVGNLVAEKNSIDGFAPSYEQVIDLRRRAREQVQPSGQRSFAGFSREILLDQISFAHPGGEEVLSDVTVRIPKGGMVALVGVSGAGKSTLIDLLIGFHQPLSGRVVVDDVPLAEFEVGSYRRHVGYVPQESVLFNATIAENLRWARAEASDEDLAAACRLAHADEFIRAFPDGYQTQVGDRGVRLSGGQVQRVALARAILRRPELLILDEATSALDSESESRIREALDDIAKQTTVVVIAHRLSTIKKADYIYVLHQGRIVEKGTYSALLSQNREFAQMVRLQSLAAGSSQQAASA